MVLIRKGTTIKTEVDNIVETAIGYGTLEDAIVFVAGWWLQRAENLHYRNRQDLKRILLEPAIKKLIESYGVETARAYMYKCIDRVQDDV